MQSQICASWRSFPRKMGFVEWGKLFPRSGNPRHTTHFQWVWQDTQVSSGLPYSPLAPCAWQYDFPLLPHSAFHLSTQLSPSTLSLVLPHRILCSHALSIFPLWLAFGTRYLFLLIRHPTPVNYYFTIILTSKSCLQPSVPQFKPHLKSQDKDAPHPYQVLWILHACRGIKMTEKQRVMAQLSSLRLNLPVRWNRWSPQNHIHNERQSVHPSFRYPL